MALANLVKQAQLMQKMQEKLAAEEEWTAEKKKLQEEIAVSKRKIEIVEAELQDILPFKYRCQTLEAKVASLEGEVQELKTEKSCMQQANLNQLEEIKRLQRVEEEKSSLHAELKGVLQKNKELQFRLERTQRDLGESGHTQQEELMMQLRNTLTKLHKEKSVWNEKEKELNKNVEDVNEENTKLRRALLDSERMRQDLQGQMEGVLEELYTLRKACLAAGENRTFKDFVQVKRELAQVKEENEDLKTKLVTRGKSNSFPSLKGHSVQSQVSLKSISRVGSATLERKPRDSLGHISKTYSSRK